MLQDSKLQSFIQNPNISLWKLTIPMTIGLFVNSIYILVDTYFLGSKIGTSAISALGYVMPFYFIIMGITFGLAAGTTTIVAQYIGKQDKNRAELVAKNSILMACFFSIFILIFIYLFGKPLLSLQVKGTEILTLALDYFYVMAFGSSFLIALMAIFLFFPSTGKAATALFILNDQYIISAPLKIASFRYVRHTSILLLD